MKKEVTRSMIMKKLEKFNQKHGMAFMSKQEAVDYYRELVDLILGLTK